MSFVISLLFITGVGAGPIQFSGSVSLQGNAEFITPETLRTPYSNLTFMLSPCLTVFGVPISTDILLSTMDNDLRQALNKFRIGLDPMSLIRQKLPVPGFMKFLPKIDFGTFSPFYSPLTLSGVAVTGFGIEYQPWKVYLAGAGGRIQRAIEGSDTTEPVYKRLLYATKFGFGKSEASHYYLTLLYAHDDSNSLKRSWRLYQPDTLEPADTFEVVTPQENYLLGMEFNLCLFEDAFRLEGEIAGTELTRDSRMEVQNYKWAPDWAERILKPRFSSQYDFAFSVRSVLNVIETRVFGEVKMVGPGYISLGAPSLRNDNLAYTLGMERSFLDNKVSLSASMNREQDNLIGMKLTTTTFTMVALNLGLVFPNLPYANISYSPYFQKSESISDRSQTLSLSTGYSFETGPLTHSPSFSISWQGHNSTPGNNYSTFDINFNHSLGFSFPLSASANFGLARTAFSDSATNTFALGLSPSYTLFGGWVNGLSLTGSFEGKNKRVDIGFNSSFPVWKLADANLSLERSIYQGTEENYRAWYLTGTLSKSW